jgi:hypothetical protein
MLRGNESRGSSGETEKKNSRELHGCLFAMIQSGEKQTKCFFTCCNAKGTRSCVSSDNIRRGPAIFVVSIAMKVLYRSLLSALKCNVVGVEDVICIKYLVGGVSRFWTS